MSSQLQFQTMNFSTIKNTPTIAISTTWDLTMEIELSVYPKDISLGIHDCDWPMMQQPTLLPESPLG